MNANHSVNWNWKAAATLPLTRRLPVALSKIEIEWVFMQVRRSVASDYGNVHARRIWIIPLSSFSTEISTLGPKGAWLHNMHLANDFDVV